jgi:single-strand DNA-binding protein
VGYPNAKVDHFRNKQHQKEHRPMQKVQLTGYLGRDPEVRYSAQGTVVAQFSVVTTERWKDRSGGLQEHTEWFAV